MNRLQVLCLFTLLLSSAAAASSASIGQSGGRSSAALHRYVPAPGPSARSIIRRAISANGGVSWERLDSIEFRQRFQVRDGTGRLQGRGRLRKRISRQDDGFFARAEDASVASPPLIRALGPDGVWIHRGGRPVTDDLIEGAWIEEAYRDYLVLSLPHALRGLDDHLIYRGVVPVRGVRCHQILVTHLPGWYPFEGREFLVSLAEDDLRLVALDDWPRSRPDRVHRAWFDYHTPLRERRRGRPWRYPRKWEYLLPDGDTITLLLDDVELDPSLPCDTFLAPSPRHTRSPDMRGSELELRPHDRVPSSPPHRSFFVRTLSWQYYMEGKHRLLLE